MKDLPDSTFCCMGRMAYMMCINAQKLLLNKDALSWFDMTEDEKLALGGKAKAVICGTFVPETNFDRLMEVTLKTMATAA
jgi:hypothetical protein